MDLPELTRPAPLVPRPAGLHQRAGDLERSAVCDELAAHFAAGRLGPDELDARLGAAMAAPTLVELRRLVADLPGPVAPPVPSRPAPAGWTAGDLLALLIVLGVLVVGGLAVLLLGFTGQVALVVVGVLSAGGGAAGGAALHHLQHRGRQQAAATAVEQAQRPRMA